jgi:predicted ArsR family transcriptional regulator
MISTNTVYSCKFYGVVLPYKRTIVKYFLIEMSSETIKKVYAALKETEPQTPNEIADVLGLNQKTVQSILLELALNNSKVKWKKIGRYRVFWKVREL